MPEGPEVAVVRDYLRYQLVGNQIYQITGPTPQVKIEFPLLVRGVECKGKNLVIDCAPYFLYCHLMMEGRWYDAVDLEEDKHRLVTLTVGRFETFLTYLCLRDTRRFAKFQILTHEELTNKLKEVGPDILQAGLLYRGLGSKLYQTELLTWERWQDILNGHGGCNIGSFLNKQEFISGIGNYLRAEILYLAKLSPWRKVKDISREERLNLYQITLSYIVDCYLCQGHSLYTFTVPKAIKAEYSKEVPLQVYGKKFDLLGNPIAMGKMGQTIHWVPKMQK